MRLTAQGKPDAVTIPDVAVHPTLPVYQEGKDIATHLTRFERVAGLLQLEPSTYAGLKEFMILDQFLALLNPDIRTFIKEHRPSSLVRAVQLADDWASAHYTIKPSRSSPRSFKPPLKKTLPVHSSPSPTSSTTRCHGCGTVNGSWTSSILRDTGCSCIVVAEVLPDADISNCLSCQVADYLGCVDTFPIVQCYIRCPYFEGWTNAIRAPIKFASVLIVCAVETRALTTRMKRLHPLHLPDFQPLSVTPEEFGHFQRTCDILTIARTKAATGEIDQAWNNSTLQFLY
ncbi:hypothetical protein E2C01_058642 [Portunus trituberculatus]|uniref:SCAN box domain-containing protein n=1 Tax=Portunus trituberculatus TaxID=210409 RepID=A0A5B7H6Q4_PORTR|nr:hypothetical protein [Portunus trituberculatus]